MKIGFASNDYSRSAKDPLGRPIMGGSGWVRIGQHIKNMKDSNYDVVVGILAFNSQSNTFGVHSFDGNDWFDCDVIVMQRYMHQFALRDMKKAQASGQIIINEIDDWYWGLSEKNRAYITSHPHANPRENINWYESIVKSSDGVIVSTHFLFDRMSVWNDNVALVTNYVDTSMFKTPYDHSIKDKPVVGWLGSTSHRSGDLEVLKPFSKSISEFANWHHSGDMNGYNIPKFHNEIGVSPAVVTYSPFVPPYELNKSMLFDVGIVPLTNIPFNHAKSYIKGLEYAAAGVPFVASWSPQYQELSDEHGIGVVVRDPQDYVKELRKFTDFDYRVEVATANRAAVQKFDTSIGSEILYNTIIELANASR